MLKYLIFVTLLCFAKCSSLATHIINIHSGPLDVTYFGLSLSFVELKYDITLDHGNMTIGTIIIDVNPFPNYGNVSAKSFTYVFNNNISSCYKHVININPLHKKYYVVINLLDSVGNNLHGVDDVFIFYHTNKSVTACAPDNMLVCGIDIDGYKQPDVNNTNNPVDVSNSSERLVFNIRFSTKGNNPVLLRNADVIIYVHLQNRNGGSPRKTELVTTTTGPYGILYIDLVYEFSTGYMLEGYSFKVLYWNNVVDLKLKDGDGNWNGAIENIPPSNYNSYGSSYTVVATEYLGDYSIKLANAYNSFYDSINWSHMNGIATITDPIQIRFASPITTFSPDGVINIESVYYNNPMVIAFLVGKWVMFNVYGKTFVMDVWDVKSVCQGDINEGNDEAKALVEGYAITYACAFYSDYTNSTQDVFYFGVNGNNYITVPVEEYICINPGYYSKDSGRIAAALWDLYDANNDCAHFSQYIPTYFYGSQSYCDHNNGYSISLLFKTLFDNKPQNAGQLASAALTLEYTNKVSLSALDILLYNWQPVAHIDSTYTTFNCPSYNMFGYKYIVTCEDKIYYCNIQSGSSGVYTTGPILSPSIYSILYYSDDIANCYTSYTYVYSYMIDSNLDGDNVYMYVDANNSLQMSTGGDPIYGMTLGI